MSPERLRIVESLIDISQNVISRMGLKTKCQIGKSEMYEGAYICCSNSYANSIKAEIAEELRSQDLCVRLRTNSHDHLISEILLIPRI